VSTVLLASSLLAASIPRVNADPAGPPVGGAVPSVPTGNWEMVNYGPTAGSYSPQNQINKGNAHLLEPKWVYPYVRTQDKISLQGAPAYGSGAPVLVVDGTLYISMNDRRVLAIDAATGKLLWNNTYGTTFDAAGVTAKYPWMALVFAHTHAISYYRDKNWLITTSLGSCNLYAVDAKTGKTAWALTTEQLCGTNAEFGDPTKGIIGSLGNQGYMANIGTHPPQFLGNVMFFPVSGSSGRGGRSFVTAFDMSDPQNPKRLYREFVQPPAQGDPNWAINECTRVNGNGWYFEYPRFLESMNHPTRDKEPTYQATKCTEVDPEVVKNDLMDMVPGSPTFGKMHTATNAGSAVWGTYPLDPETGIVYVGWGDQGPYTNLTNRYGPGLHGSGFTAFDVKTGKMVWWYQSVIHDLWDYDCSWSGILGQVQGKKAYIKGCKDGIVRALDAATGKPFWTFDPSTVARNAGQNYGVDKNNDPKGKDACCRLTKEHMSKPWMHYPNKEPILINCYTTCLESDIAYDGKRVYLASFNSPVRHTVTNVVPFGNQGVGALGGNPAPQVQNETEFQRRLNTNIYAVDVNTGKAVWTARTEGFGYRGGLSVTGGMVMSYSQDGSLKFFDAETGKLVHQKFYGFPINVMPTVGASKDGKYKLFLHVGGGGSAFALASWYTNNDGSLVALGLPDKLPEPAEVAREALKEVPKEQLKEVLKDIPKEALRELAPTTEVISPISYGIVGVGIVLVVIAGVIFSRRKKA